MNPTSLERFVFLRGDLYKCVMGLGIAAQKSTPLGRWHVQYGIGRRLFVLIRNYETIAKIAPEDRQNAISLEEQTELDIHLNSFYLHAAGLLDNLAWAIHYHIRQPDGIDEQKGIGLSKIGLFKPEFKKALRAASPELSKVIDSLADWHQLLKRLRDPIAHRIPIYAVPAILNDDEMKEYQAKYSEFMAGIGKRTEQESDLLLDEIKNMSTYKPIFSLSDSNQETIYPIRPRIDIDVENIVKVLFSGLKLITNGIADENGAITSR